MLEEPYIVMFLVVAPGDHWPRGLMLEEPYIVMFLVVALTAFVMMCVLVHYDRIWSLEAEWVRDWERHRDEYMQSRLRLDEVADEAGFIGDGLAKMREHDFANETYCARQAETHRARIPKWVRRYYLVA